MTVLQGVLAGVGLAAAILFGVWRMIESSRKENCEAHAGIGQRIDRVEEDLGQRIDRVEEGVGQKLDRVVHDVAFPAGTADQAMFDDSGVERSAREAPAPASDPAVVRFRACRWHDEADGGAEYCGHGEVLPYAGRNGFNPQAWCPDCTFYKARRRTRRRDATDLDDFDFPL